MATISVRAGVALHLAERHPEQTVEALETIKKIGDDGLAEVRSILGILRSDDDLTVNGSRLPRGSLARLDPLLDANRATGLDVEVRVAGQARVVPAAVDLAAYRIVQESLTNVARHANARRAEVEIGYERSQLRISVRDDGVGQSGAAVAGHGISGMRERAAALGGVFHAGTLSGGGFEVRCVLPLPPGSSAAEPV